MVGATFYCRNMLIFISTWGSNLYHNYQWSESRKLIRIPTNVSWNVGISLSAKFRQCMCGGTNSWFIPFYLITSLYLANASLHEICFLEKIPVAWKQLMKFSYMHIIYPSIIFFMGSTIIEFTSISHRTMMSLLPWSEHAGNFPVWAV